MTLRHHHHDPVRNRSRHQAGLGTFALVGILTGLGIVFLVIFFAANSDTSNKPSTTNQTANNNGDTTATPTVKEPPYIRIPENSLIYKSTDYKFSFAYPASFQKLTENADATAGDVGSIFRAEAIRADKKPVGNNQATMSGTFGAYVYRKDDFKILVTEPDVYVSATKTGNDTTWKVISRGNTNQDISIGSAYQVKTIRSQTGVPVFNFTLNKGKSVYGRYVFEAGDYYVLIALPEVSLPSNTPPSERDIAAYSIIGNNLSSTVRTQAVSSNTNTSGGNSSTGATDQSSGTTGTTSN
jgi:hypothetical protein